MLFACASAGFAVACGDDEQAEAPAQQAVAQQAESAQQQTESASRQADSEQQQQQTEAQQAAAQQQSGQQQQAEQAEGPVLLVVTSNGVIGDWTRQVAGDLAEVRVLTPPGADVHTLELSVSDVRAITEADLTVMNGATLESSWQSLVEENAGRVLWLAEAVEEAGYALAPFSAGMVHDDHGDEEDEHGHEEEDDDHAHEGEEEEGEHEHEEGEEEDEHGHEEDEEDDHAHEDEEGDDHGEEEGHDEDEDHAHEDEEDDHAHEDEEDGDHDDHDEHEEDEHGHAHDHGDEDPHFWFDLELASASVRAIAAELTALRPDAADAIAERLEAYLEEMADADAEAAALLSDLSEGERLLVTFHDAYGYFARRYGLEVTGVVVEGPEQDAGAGEIAELIELIEHEGVVRIYREPQFDSSLVESISDQTGVPVAVIYSQPTDDVGTWTEILLANARAVAGR